MAVVVGIVPDHDSLAALTDALRNGGVDVTRLEVISHETPATELIETGLQFTYSGGTDAVVGSGGGILTSGGGTGVPGLTSRAAMPAFRDDNIDTMLGELEIPDSRFDFYRRALDARKTVVAYPTGDDVDAEKVKPLFAAAGASPIEVF